MKTVPITTNLSETKKRPYFLWDELLTVQELYEILNSGNMDKRLNYMAKILREARFEHVWEFLSVQDILANWEYLKKKLGRKKAFWEFFLRKWREYGLI
jgi:maltooligosyltrehalose synthase